VLFGELGMKLPDAVSLLTLRGMPDRKSWIALLLLFVNEYQIIVLSVDVEV
jgi:hypothetical protein